MNILKISFILTLCLQLPLMGKQLATDSGKLYPTEVANIIYPKTVAEIQKIVQEAHKNKQSISIAGARHSQGGHSNAKDSTQLDLQYFNKMLKLDTKNKEVTVQPGMTWEQLQDCLQPHKLSIKVMQASNIFSIGGSIATNVHGRDPRFGPLIDAIKSCKIIIPTGEIKTISPKENKELFSLVVGGYGLFGILIEATLTVTDNVMCAKQQKTLYPNKYITYFQKNVLNNPKVELHYARLNTTPGNQFFNELLSISYVATKSVVDTKPLRTETNISFNQWVFDLFRKKWGKITNYIKWLLEKHLTPPWENAKETSRNQLMRPYIYSLENKDPQSTDLLQEYFIPLHKFNQFILDLKSATEQHKIKLLNTTIRYVPKNTNNLLTYAEHECMAFVLYFTTELDQSSMDAVKQYTDDLTNASLKYGGTFYLPYQRFATKEQLLKGYPKFPEFIEKKQEYDPDGIFMNNWYQHYIVKLFD